MKKYPFNLTVGTGIFFFLLGVGIFLFLKPTSLKKNIEINEEVLIQKKTNEVFREKIVLKSPKKSKKDKIMNSFSILEWIPTLEQVRREVLNDPHNTPPSFMKFSKEVGMRLHKALHSEKMAFDLYSDLKTCVVDSEQQITTAIQAFCLSEMKLLSSQYPDLFESDLKSFLLEVNSQIIHLVDRLNPEEN